MAVCGCGANSIVAKRPVNCPIENKRTDHGNVKLIEGSVPDRRPREDYPVVKRGHSQQQRTDSNPVNKSSSSDTSGTQVHDALNESKIRSRSKQIVPVSVNKSGSFPRPPALPVKRSTTKKEYVRFCEVPVNRRLLEVDPQVLFDYSDFRRSDVDKTNYRTPFEAPELFSTLRIAKKIQDTKALVEGKKPTPVPFPLSVKEIATKKAAKSINFSPEDRVFKDLIPVDIRKEDFQQPKRLMKVSREVSGKDIEPELSEFFTPSYCIEYTTHSKMELSSVTSSIQYDGYSIYMRTKFW